MVCLEKWLAPAISKISAKKNRPRTTTAPCQKFIASTSLEIAFEFVAMYFLLLVVESAYEQPRKLSLSAPAKNLFPFVFSISALLTGVLWIREIHLSPRRKLRRLPTCDVVCERNLVVRSGTQVGVRLEVTKHFRYLGGPSKQTRIDFLWHLFE